MLLLSSVNFIKINLFRNTIRVSNGLHLDQKRRSVNPDLGSNCLQMLSTDDKIRHYQGKGYMTTFEPGVHVIALYTNHGNESYKSVNHDQPVSLEANFSLYTRFKANNAHSAPISANTTFQSIVLTPPSPNNNR